MVKTVSIYELCWERGEQVSTMIIKAKSEEQARKWFSENCPGKTIIGFGENYDFKPGKPIVEVLEETTGNTMNLTTEAIIKQIKQSLIDGNGYDVWDNGEMNVWNYKLEVFDGIVVTLIVWQDEFLEGDEELYTRTNYFTMTIKEFLKTPWRKLEKRINEACSYAC